MRAWMGYKVEPNYTEQWASMDVKSWRGMRRFGFGMKPPKTASMNPTGQGREKRVEKKKREIDSR